MQEISFWSMLTVLIYLSSDDEVSLINELYGTDDCIHLVMS
jgi:hypothetical protein